MPTTFFSDLLTSISDRGRQILRLGERPLEQNELVSGLLELCEQVLSGRGEASGAALAREVLDLYTQLDEEHEIRFFHCLAEDFGVDPTKLAAASLAWTHNQTQDTAADLHFASEARRQELFRRLNRAPGGTAALVHMRAALLRAARNFPELRSIDRDFSHLLSSWFNRGFLELHHIDWSSPAIILEKIIRYEAVHQIRDWDDLRRRIDPPDRRCYGFFHPALKDEPLIFVEVALTADIPGAIQPLLAEQREPMNPADARTAVFYSISNCQYGLAGISFGNFLIKQVVEELRRELPKLERFVTLSPVPGFNRWLEGEAGALLADDEQLSMAQLAGEKWQDDEKAAGELKPMLESLAAIYFTGIRTPGGRVVDPVARFHLGNGARLERINWLGDRSEKGLRESAGIMVNYQYDLDEIEQNHEAFANRNEVAASPQVKKLVRSGHKGLVRAIEEARRHRAAAPPDATASPTSTVTPHQAPQDDATPEAAGGEQETQSGLPDNNRLQKRAAS